MAPRLLHAAPAALTALALLVLLVLVRDALWRGPVTVPQATVDWLLGTPVDRRRLLRPRFRCPAAGAMLAGAVVGIVPAAALVALGLGGRYGGDVLRLTGAAMLSMGLLFALATGLAGLIERYPATGRWVRAATPVALAAAVLLGGLAAWAAFGHGCRRRRGRHGAALVRPVGLGGPAGDRRGRARRARPAWPRIPAAVVAGRHRAAGRGGAGRAGRGSRAAAGVPAAALRARARTLGAMSSAALSMNTRGVAAAYTAAAAAPAGPGSTCRRHGGASSCCPGATCSRWPAPRPGWPRRCCWPGWPSG